MKQIISTLIAFSVGFGMMKSYPQLINIDTVIHSDKAYSIVDKVIIEEDDYLKINVKYPQVSKGLKKLDVLNNKVEKWTLDWLDDIRLLVKNNYGNNYPKPNQKYEAMATYDIKTNYKILSLITTYYQYTGGAHGLTTVIPYNYNKMKDELFKLEDMFKNGYDYKKIINDEITKQIAMDKEKYFDGSYGFNGIKDNQNFYIYNDNIVILFGLYEIAPYAAGIIEFPIPINLFENGIDYDKIN